VSLVVDVISIVLILLTLHRDQHHRPIIAMGVYVIRKLQN